MPSTILLRSPDAIADKRIVLSNSQFARPFNIGTWNKIRIAVRWGARYMSPGPAGNITWMLGLCSGSTNLPGDATCTHAVGCGHNTGSAWTPSGVAGTTAHYGTGQILAMKKVNTTFTTTLYLESSGDISAGADQTGKQRDLFFLDITKGSPNYTLQTYCRYFSNTALDISATNFLLYAETEAGLTLVPYEYGTARALAVDEGVDGALNHVFFWWSRTQPMIEISDIAIVKFS